MSRVRYALCALLSGVALLRAEDAPAPRPATSPHLLARAERFAARGQLDLYVAVTAALHLRAEDERLWIPPFKAGRGLVHEAGMVGERRPKGGPTGFDDFATYRAKHSPAFLRQEALYTRPKSRHADELVCIYDVAVQAPEVRAEWTLHGFVVSRGPVTVKVGIRSALVFANGTVSAPSIQGAVVISDGDVIAEAGIGNSLVIARGKVVTGSVDGSTIVSGDSIRYKQMPVAPPLCEDVNVNKALIARFEPRRVDLREKDAHPLGFVTFFELHRVGLEVKAEGPAVVVSKVAAKSEAERAGVKAGDVVLAVGGTKPTDAEHLRRALRDALAVGDAKVQLKRGAETLTVTLTLPE
jgi:PDZ domain